MKKLYDNLISIDLTEEVAARRQASRSHFMYKDGAREATKDIMEYLQEQGILCAKPGETKKKYLGSLCLEDREAAVGRVACADLYQYLNNLYYTGQTRFFQE